MTLDSQEVTIDELCNFFSDFLKACSYNLGENARIDLVEDESDAVYADNYNYNSESVGDDEFSASLDSEADEFMNGMINEEFTNEDDSPREVQTEFNFGDKI